MKVALLDPALFSVGGHHFDLDRGIARELARRGHDVTVFSHRQISSSAAHGLGGIASLQPLFRVPSYRIPGLFSAETGFGSFDATAGGLVFLLDGARFTADDLNQVQGFDLWLWPTMLPQHLLACSLSRSPVPVAGQMHVEPGHGGPLDEAFWRYAVLDALRSGIRVRLGTNTADLVGAYAALIPEAPVSLWPIYIDGRLPARPRQQLQCIGFFGAQQRMEKGLSLLEELVAELASQGFDVIVQDSERLAPAAASPNIRRLGYVADLSTAIEQCDLVVTPYDPAAYRLRGSGIIWEAMACGVPAVAPAGTGPGRFVEQHGAGMTFASASLPDIIETIAKARADFRKLAERTFEAAKAWRTANGMSRLVDALLAMESGGHA